MGDTKGYPRVIIVGAGLAGISTAIQLKKKLRFENFTIYEKADTVGGTWRQNTYPGCGSDIPGHWYSLSTDLNPYWSSHHVSQPEILAYWKDLYRKYDLAAHTVFGHGIHYAEWDSDRQVYKVVVKNAATGEQTNVEAEILFLAIGGFSSPAYPKDITGIDKFRGLVWHSAEWRHDVDLRGKRVGLIGNGCSVTQILPKISADSSVKVVNFCRTPQWFIPRPNFRYATWLKWVFAHVPLVMRWYRISIMAQSDINFVMYRKDNVRLSEYAKRIMSLYIKKMAPKDQIPCLIPDYPPGCKRVIKDPGYLEALHRPNVSVKWDAIEGLVENGIKLRTGEIIPLDIIVFGTGFSIMSTDLNVQGSKGQTLMEYYAAHGGPTAYLGSCMPGFPNLFMLLGPNVATGHASVIFSQESQIGFALQLIKPVLDSQAKSFEVAEEATEEYNAWVQNRLSRSVWTECNSYYQLDGQKGSKNISMFPGPVSLFWWLSLSPPWNKFHGVAAERWEKQRRINTGKWWSGLGILALVVVLGRTGAGLW